MSAALSNSREQLQRFEVVKGWGFVAATAALLFVVLRRMERRLESWAREATRARRQYLAVVERSPTAIVIQQNEKLVFANEAASALFRATPSSPLVGRGIFELLEPAEHESAAARSALAAAGEAVPSFMRRRAIALDGTRITVEAGVAPVAWEGHRAIQVTIRDITETERLQDEARALESKASARAAELEAVFEAIDEAIAVTDLQHVITRVNRRYIELYGLNPIGLRALDVLNRVARTPPRRSFAERASAGEEVNGQELEVVNETGRVRTLSVTAQPMRDAAGIVQGVVVAGRDVTERVAHARALEALTNGLQGRLEEARAQIARDLHDDLGQVLTALKMQLDAVERRLEEAPPSPAINEVTDRLVDGSALVNDAINRVRDIATSLRTPALDALGLADALSAEVRAFRDRTGLVCQATLQVDEAALSPRARTALFRIAQEALTNVARHARASTVMVRLSSDDSVVCLEVEDDGVGFDPAGPARNSLGILGMKERASALGGEVELRSGSPRGAKVVARLPLRSEGRPP